MLNFASLKPRTNHKMDFSELYTDYFNRLVQTASIWNSHEDAEDIVQDVLVRLWERRDSLVFVQDPYLYALAAVRHRCIDRLKHLTYVREHQRGMWSAMRMACDLETPATQAEYHDLECRVERAVHQLPQRCREVFIKSRYDGKHYAEIAHEFGIAVNTVECHMTIALTRLRKSLKVS